MTELYFFNENGQMEINFDSLLLKTSERFVERVQSTITKSNYNLIVKVDDNELETRVILISPNCAIKILEWCKGKEEYSYHYLNSYDLEEIISALGGSIQWGGIK